MTTIVIIILSSILIVSYFFDLSSRITKVPGVILLISLGIGLNYIVNITKVNLPSLDKLTPIIGTVGLILIVLEGSLELKISSKKLIVVRKTFLSGLILLVINSIFITIFIMNFYDVSFFKALVNSIPLSIISSALAIPAAQHLSDEKKEFITYESSFSDILGIILFNFFALNEAHGITEISFFTLHLFLICLIAIACSLFLGFLLQRIQHHIKFIPIIATLILIYSIAKLIHLPSLIVVMVFGLFLNNIEKMERFTVAKSVIDFEVMEKEITNFKYLVGELTFAIRSFFFILLGFLTDFKSILELNGLIISVTLLLLILLTRWFLFKFIMNIPILPEVFFAPRGLITVLLFIGIPATYAIPEITITMLLQFILVTSIAMTIGLILPKPKVL